MGGGNHFVTKFFSRSAECSDVNLRHIQTSKKLTVLQNKVHLIVLIPRECHATVRACIDLAHHMLLFYEEWLQEARAHARAYVFGDDSMQIDFCRQSLFKSHEIPMYGE